MPQRFRSPILVFLLFLAPGVLPPSDGLAQPEDLEEEFLAAQAAMEKEYRDFEREAFEEFRREVEAMWNDFLVSTKKDWVEYSGDKTGRSLVDFESGQATVEVLVPREEARRDPEAVRKRLEQELERLVADRGKTRDYEVPLRAGPPEEGIRLAARQEAGPSPAPRTALPAPGMAVPAERRPPEVEPPQAPAQRPALRDRADELLSAPDLPPAPAPLARKPEPVPPQVPAQRPALRDRADELLSAPDLPPAPAPTAAPVETSLRAPAAAVIAPQPLLPVPVLENQLEDRQGRVVTEETKEAFAKEVVATRPVEQEVIRTKQGEMVKATVTVPLVPDHLRIRAERHLDDVRTHASRFKVDVPLAFAVIHTESFFNPKAKSHVPAYGLMQLVPTSGGRDAYRYVYGEDRILGADYLYQPGQNIELGCAYLGLLQHRTFRNVKHRQSAKYCAIASYNTGAGNLSRAFTGNKQIGPAVERINTMTPDQLYAHLVRNLPYRETQDYIKKVRERMALYQEWK